MKVMNETNGLNIGVEPNTRISTCISRCEKGISPIRKMKSRMQFNGSEKTLDDSISIRNAFTAREINLEKKLSPNGNKFDSSRMFKNIEEFHPYDYLKLVESHIPKKLLSQKNYSEIKSVANYFKNNLTSFFGFESKLGDLTPESDYMFAISSKKGERESIKKYLQSKNIPKEFKEKQEWQRVSKLVKYWGEKESEIYEKILGLWFEFDIIDSTNKTPIPSIFLHTVSIKNKDIQNINWLTEKTLPALMGQNIPEKLEKNLLNCIKNLPEKASLFNIGIMLSRPTYGIRVVVKRLQPNKIIPYLEKLGWKDKNDQLKNLISELENEATRLVLSFDILQDGVGPKIGIECGFYPKKHDEYAPESRWKNLLEYLVEKGLCLDHKKDALLNFISGMETEISTLTNGNEPLLISTKIDDPEYKNTLVRQIGHIKIVYYPDKPLEAKAYYGARLFGIEEQEITRMTQ